MSYDSTRIDLNILLTPLCRAGEALSRLDECVARSPIREGFRERLDFADAVASMWVDGELVHVEDLVLHDARRDARTPTHELTIAHSILRTRRQIFDHPADWAMSPAGLSRLRGREFATVDISPAPVPTAAAKPASSDMSDENDGEQSSAEFAEVDAIIARSSALLEDAINAKATLTRSSDKDPLIYDADWDEEERLAEWQDVLGATAALPAVLRAALLLDAWNQLQVLQHRAELGRQLVASFLRAERVVASHLGAINIGLKAVRIEKRRSPDRMTRLLAILEAFEIAATNGLKEHDRLLASKAQLERKLVNRRGHSRLPQLVDLVISRPVVSANLIADALDVTPQGALVLTKELGLREFTGRGRYRAWGVL